MYNSFVINDSNQLEKKLGNLYQELLASTTFKKSRTISKHVLYNLLESTSSCFIFISYAQIPCTCPIMGGKGGGENPCNHQFGLVTSSF